MRKYTIRVTQDDIYNGVPRAIDNCAVARAIRRDTGDPNAEVGIVFCEVNGHDVNVPRFVSDFITRFDDGYPVEPFEFDIHVPEDTPDYIDLGGES